MSLFYLPDYLAPNVVFLPSGLSSAESRLLMLPEFPDKDDEHDEIGNKHEKNWKKEVQL